MPYPDSEYPSILRGRDKRESRRLLAAAPDMLKFVRLAAAYANDTKERFLMDWDSEDEDAYEELCDAADAIIAKAEGRSE